MTSIHHTQEFYEKKRIYTERPTKVCIKCNIEKDKSNFTTDRKHRDGKSPICNFCKKMMKRDLYKKQPERFYASLARSAGKFPEKVKARAIVNRAVKRGKLKKKECCENCGISGVRIEAHHHMGYEKENVLNVKWLCTPCHRKEDMV